MGEEPISNRTGEAVPARTAADELTFILLYLFRMGPDHGFYSSWKGHDFNTLDRLEEQGLIMQDRNKTRCKSVWFGPESLEEARKLLKKYGIEDWKRIWHG